LKTRFFLIGFTFEAAPMVQHQLEINSTLAGTAGRRALRREAVDVLLDRANHLAPADRALVRSVLEAGARPADLALVANRGSQAIRRRLRRLLERLRSESFACVLRDGERWPPQRRAVAQAVMLRGQSQRQAAATLGLSVHSVRRELDRIRTLCETGMDSSHGRSERMDDFALDADETD
jgi:DNA-directed RNA polymerase specialized sigma24 family protein